MLIRELEEICKAKSTELATCRRQKEYPAGVCRYVAVHCLPIPEPRASSACQPLASNVQHAAWANVRQEASVRLVSMVSLVVVLVVVVAVDRAKKEETDLATQMPSSCPTAQG